MVNHRRMWGFGLSIILPFYGNFTCMFSSYRVFKIVVVCCCICRIEINCYRCCCMRIHKYRELFWTCLLSMPYPRLESIMASSRLVNQQFSKAPRSIHVLSSSSPKPLTAEQFLIKNGHIFRRKHENWMHFKLQTKQLHRHRICGKGLTNLKDTNSLTH